MNVVEPLAGETKYSPTYIYRQIFGTKMKGHHQTWPDIRLDELRRINPDTVGWIHMEDSPINYPVVRSRLSADYYLTHNFSGEESYHGAVSMDYRNGGVLGVRTTVLTAHHMKDCSMFALVSALFSPDYYEEHKGLDLLLCDGMYRAEFFAVHYINSRDPEPIRTGFSSDEDYESWLAERKRRAFYETPLTPGANDRVLVLTTCVFPDDPNDWRNEVAAYAVLRKAEDRTHIPEDTEKRGELPELLRLVNLTHPLPEDYKPELVSIGDGKEIDCRCRPYLTALMEDCRAAGGRPFVVWAYRSAECQEELFERFVEEYMSGMRIDRRLARGFASFRCAPPGASEHQLGLAADLSAMEGTPDTESSFTTQWLEQNAWRYGFILRYPKGKEDTTGFLFEPWHYRFVGREYAEDIYQRGLTLEEYTELLYEA